MNQGLSFDSKYQNEVWPMNTIDLLEIIAGYAAFTYGSRNVSQYNYFINLHPPKWIRRVLLLQNSGSISLIGFVMQIIITLLTIVCLLNWFGINVFSAFGDFNTIFSLSSRKNISMKWS